MDMLTNIIEMIDKIKVNKQNGKASVYKPLLLMLIFKAIQKGEKNEFKR